MKEPRFYRIVRPIICILFRIIYRPVIIGEDYIPKEGRVVLAGNHTNNLDCILLMSSTSRTIHFLAKDELISGKCGFIFKNMGIIPVNRKIHDKDALKEAISFLNSDRVIGIFPEGTFNRSNDIILPFKIGAVKMAHDTSSILIPFTITGHYKIFRKNIKLTFYKPIKIGDNLTEENNRLMNIIKKELGKEKR